MSDRISVTVDQKHFENLVNQFGERMVNDAIRVTRDYTQKVQSEAREIIRDSGHVDTGAMLNRIQTLVDTTRLGVKGEVNNAVKYARFWHEGAQHKSDTELEKHFVSFAVAPSLLKWAKKHGVIYQKTNKGSARKKAVKGGQWYMKSKKTDKEYSVNVETGGLMVQAEQLKYLEIPFNNCIDSYLNRIAEVVANG